MKNYIQKRIFWVGDKTSPDAKRKEQGGRRRKRMVRKSRAVRLMVKVIFMPGAMAVAFMSRTTSSSLPSVEVALLSSQQLAAQERSAHAVHVMQDAAGVHVMDALAGGCRLGDFKSVPLGVGAKRPPMPLAHSKHTAANNNSNSFVAVLVEKSSNAIKQGAYICFPFLKPARQPTREKQAPAQASV
jgi:hypothetical protein